MVQMPITSAEATVASSVSRVRKKASTASSAAAQSIGDNPTASASKVDAWSIGLNWYLTQNLKLVANYTQAAFAGGAADGADREDEKTVFTRAQISF